MSITTAAALANRRANTPIMLTLALVGALVGATAGYQEGRPGIMKKSPFIL